MLGLAYRTSFEKKAAQAHLRLHLSKYHSVVTAHLLVRLDNVVFFNDLQVIILKETVHEKAASAEAYLESKVLPYTQHKHH